MSEVMSIFKKKNLAKEDAERFFTSVTAEDTNWDCILTSNKLFHELYSSSFNKLEMWTEKYRYCADLEKKIKERYGYLKSDDLTEVDARHPQGTVTKGIFSEVKQIRADIERKVHGSDTMYRLLPEINAEIDKLTAQMRNQPKSQKQAMWSAKLTYMRSIKDKIQKNGVVTEKEREGLLGKQENRALIVSGFFSKTERIDLKIEKAIEEAKEKKVSAETGVITLTRG